MSRVDDKARGGSPVPGATSGAGPAPASGPEGPVRPSAPGNAGSTKRSSDGVELLRAFLPELDNLVTTLKTGLSNAGRSPARSVPPSSVVPPPAASHTTSQIARNRDAIGVSTSTKQVSSHAPWDINQYAPRNTPGKVTTFRALVKAEEQLDKAIVGEKQARAAAEKAERQHAAAPSATTAKHLESAEKQLAGATAKRVKEESEMVAAERAVRQEMKKQSSDKGAEIDALDLRNRTVDKQIHTVKVGDRTVTVKNAVEAYGTVDARGLVSEEQAGDRPAVKTAIDRSGFGASAKNVLMGTSANEGTFGTINGWDSKGITFGFIQMAGGRAGDTLPVFLAQFKKDNPQAFADTLQKYGIDVERSAKGPELVVREPDGSVLRGADAARKIGTDPKLAGALSAAGQNPDMQQGQLKFAKGYLDSQRAAEIDVNGEKVKISDLITSEYGNGILFDRSVHEGKGGARATLDRVATEYLAKHPGAKLTDESVRAGIEAAYIAEVNKSNDLKGRNANIASRTSAARGSYVD
jgi:hypothetical protein